MLFELMTIQNCAVKNPSWTDYFQADITSSLDLFPHC